MHPFRSILISAERSRRQLSQSGTFAIVTWILLTTYTLAPAALTKDDAGAPKLDRTKFASPPSEYRPVDCWWWDNGVLTKEHLRWQLEEMHAKGVGGTWLYPRFGALQPQSSDPGFFTDGWWEFVRFVLDEHARLGMVQYANDWLGRLDKAYFQTQIRRESKQRPELAGSRLVAHFAHSSSAEVLTVDVPADETILSAVGYKLREAHEDMVDDDSRVELKEFIHDHQVKWEAPEPEWLIAVICSQPYDLNYLERRVADRWMQMLYEPYQQKLGKRLGISLAAYGPDERAVLGGNILYSDSLRTRFEKEKGSDPIPDLAALFIDIGRRTDCVRCQYYDVMNTLLEESLYAPMANWLHERNMRHVTIATWGRANLLQQTSNYGDFPRMMKYFDMPGNEDSGESGPGGAFIDTKMSSSMAHLNGHSRVGLCAYWGMGWGYTQSENVGRTNLNYALGANLYNTHGVLYSLLGGRNEWVPPEIHFYQPYWQTWRTFTDYVSRLSYVLSQGQHKADVALVYPLSTIHANWRGGSKFAQAAHDSQDAAIGLAKSLYANSVDFDFVDEAQLAAGKIERGALKINALEFPVVVLPAMTTIRGDVMSRLSEFVESGGTLVVFRDPPTSSAESGRDDPALKQTWEKLLGDDFASNESVVQQRNAAGGSTIVIRSSESSVSESIRKAIASDVTSTAGDLAHTHQQVGKQHVYYFVNRQRQPRNVTITVRAQGRPYIWDAHTGEVRPLFRYHALPHGTELRLAMESQEGIVVVFEAEPLGPQLTTDNLSIVKSAESHPDSVDVTASAERTEDLHAEVSVEGRVFAGRIPTAPAVTTINLDGTWECEYRPTMDNRWGDFRYPATNELIGPEAPRMKYRAEPVDKPRPNWEAANVDDKGWDQVTCTYGPYWQSLEPISARLDSEELRKQIGGLADNAAPISIGGMPHKWRPYSYSWKYGADRADVHQPDKYGLGPVSPNFLVFDAPRGGQPVIHYLATRVFSPREQTLHLDFGGNEKLPARQAWINGESAFESDGKTAPTLANVKLRRGWNRIVLRMMHSGAKRLATFAVLHSQPQTPEQPRFDPLSRWLNIAPELIYDCKHDGMQSAGWYRFAAPPGAEKAKLNLNARSIEAWIDGKEVKVVDDTIQFPNTSSGPTSMSQVALRVHHKLGCYDGAAFLTPVAFECGRGKIDLGDWSKSGLAYYSGGVKYIRHIKLDPLQNSQLVLLDLGDMRTSAEVKANGRSIGVRLAPPYTFDLSDTVHAGDNEIEVEVLNTLANYMSAGPSRYVFPGQTVSGLLGPVSLRLVPQVRIQCRPVKENSVKTKGETG